MKLEMKKLVERNQELETVNHLLQQRADELEEYQRVNNLEIKGLPNDFDEMTVLKKIWNKQVETLDETDTDVCHTEKTPTPPGKKTWLFDWHAAPSETPFSLKHEKPGNRVIPWFRRPKQSHFHQWTPR